MKTLSEKATAAKVLLVCSIALLVATIGLQVTRATTRRSDLQGAEVRVIPNSVGTVAKRKTPANPASPSPPARPMSPASGQPSSPQHDSSQDATGIAIPPVEPGIPANITIPSLDLDANIVSVGIKDSGAMQIPGAIEAGWYRFGPRPGSTEGSAVIAGHVDHRKTPGVFIELRRIDIGAEVVVTDDVGLTHRYAVVERYQIHKTELPVTELFRRTGRPVLTLITCGGEFDRKTRSYEDNIVITAIPI